MRNKYVVRKIENDLKRSLKDFPVVILTGPRQTGKSTLLQHSFSGYKYVTLEDPSIRDQAVHDPRLLLDNLFPKGIIDEIQYVPELLPLIKFYVDKNRSLKGTYILTGSENFSLMSRVTESLAGRAAIHEMLPFSFEEWPLKKKKLSCSETFAFMYTGFYPDPLVHGVERDRYYRSYLQTYLERDIRQILSVRDLRIFQNFIELLAARIGNILNINEVVKECGVSFTTGKRWLSLLEATGIVYLLRPYFRNITKRVVKSPKIYFTDTGLVSYILGYPNALTMERGPHRGAFFENLMIMEVLKYKLNHGKNFKLFFFRDTHNNEIDLILEQADRQVLIEIKANTSPSREHFKYLSKENLNFNNLQKYLVCFSKESRLFGDNAEIIHWTQMTDCL